MDNSRRAPSPTPSVGSSTGSNAPPGMQNYPHPGSLPYPPAPPQHPMYAMHHHMPPNPSLMHPPPPPHMPPSSHTLSHLFPNLNMQQTNRSPSPSGPRYTSPSDPELTTSSSTHSSQQHDMSALPVPTLMRPISGPPANLPPPPLAPIRSASLSSPGVLRPGTRLVGPNPVYEPKLDPDTRSLEVTPITLYVSERASDLGTLISVNEHYISYPIRNGLIRVINQSSVNRILLRKHEQHAVTELNFFNDHTDLLLSAGTDNTIVIWRLAEDVYASKPMTREILKTLPCRAQRVKWHPLDSNKIVIVQDDTAFVTDLSFVDDSAFDLHATSVVCRQSDAAINDVTFTRDSHSLLTAGNDGLVHMYRVGHGRLGDEGDFVRRFDPLDGLALNSLHLFDNNNGDPTLLIGGGGNTVLSVWNAPVDTSIEPEVVQTVRLNSSHAHELVVDASKQFVFVADRSHAVLYVLHIAASSSGRVLDHITEFSLAYPILSMTVLHKSDPRSTDDSGGLVMQLYCIQTQAIQRYHVQSLACYIPPPPQPAQPRSSPSLTSTPRSPLANNQAPVQTVGAMTTEDDSDAAAAAAAATDNYEQSAAESPRAVASPETELDISITVHDFNGSEEGLSSMLATDGGGGSVGGHSDDQQDMDSMLLHHQPSNQISPRSVSSLPMPPPKEQYSPTSSSVHNAFMDASSMHDDTNVVAMLRRLEMQQRDHFDQMKEQQALFASQMQSHVDKSIKKHLQSIVVPAMGRIVMHTMENNWMKPLQKAVQDALDAKNLQEDLREPVRDAFRECFQAHIIPSFQAATQKMFEQIQDTFVQGTRAKVIESNQNLDDFQTQLVHLTQLMNQVTDQLSQANASASPAPPQESIFDQQCRTIWQLFDEQKYEEGFQLALGAENVALVRAACSKIDPQTVLGTRPPFLSQMIILCLVQQLGSNALDLDHLQLTISWLRESLLVMNPKDASIAPFVQGVLHELKSTLGQVPDEARDSQYTLVHHILNSMLSFSQS
ncbi:hypothetical protein AeMF1_000036 [Aphanomyces euteiches]|nr:hypothetical protein AeMF1_000036 [Aphanomyces euteiches]